VVPIKLTPRRAAPTRGTGDLCVSAGSPSGQGSLALAKSAA